MSSVRYLDKPPRFWPALLREPAAKTSLLATAAMRWSLRSTWLRWPPSSPIEARRQLSGYTRSP